MDLPRAFQILEIQESASLPEIKKAYRDLTQVWHPDRYTNNPRLYEKSVEKMKEINAAYECIVEHKRKTDRDTYTAPSEEVGFVFLNCPNCQTKNRVPEGYSNNITIKCGRCGFAIRKGDSESREADWSQRTLCGDGDCIGIIGPNGRCDICGKTYSEGKKFDEHKTALRNEQFQQRLRKERKRKIRRYSFIGLGILAFVALVFFLNRSDNAVPEKPTQVPISQKPIIPTKTRPEFQLPKTEFQLPKSEFSPNQSLANKTRTDSQIQKPEVFLNRSLPNGTMIRKGNLDGSGRLTIKNGLDRDAAAKVIDKKRDVCIAYYYIKARSNSTLNGIGDGEYRLLFVTGQDWDQTRECFTREVAFSEFNRLMLYETREQIRDERVSQQYTIIEVTLHPVPGGNVRTSTISSEFFNKY